MGLVGGATVFSTAFSLRTVMAGLSKMTLVSGFGVVFGVVDGDGSEAKRPLRALTWVFSPSLKSRAFSNAGRAVGALMVLVIVLVAAMGWAVKVKMLGILLVFFQVKRVGL